MSASSERGIRQRQLGELMTELGLLSEDQLATVLEVQQESKRPLGQIIVELGFASGAAVAHALAMQSGGSLKTEFGFALGIQAGQGETDESRADFPKLRLARKAAAPPAESNVEPTEPAQPAPDAVMREPLTLVSAAADSPAIEPDEVPPADMNTVIVVDETPGELDALRSEIARLEAALVEARGAAEAEQQRLLADLAMLEARTETQTGQEQAIAQLREDYTQATSEVERLQTALAEAQSAHDEELGTLREAHAQAMAELERAQAILTANQGADDEERSQLRSAYEQATAEVERLQASLAETQSAEAEMLTQLRAEHDQATAEVERLQTTLVEAETQHAQELGRLRDAHDRVTAELDKLLASIPEAEAAAASEQERLLAELTQLESNRAEAEAAHTQELAQLRDEHEDAVAEIERLQTALAETRTADEQELVQLRGEHERATAEVERLQTTLAEAESAHAEEVAALERAHAHATAELETLRTTIDAAAAAVQEQERLRAELAEFQAARAEADTVHEQELSQLREAHAHATAEVERLQTMLAEEAREQATAETERLQGELTVLEQAHTHALAELETLRTTISAAAEAVQEQERLRAELAELEQARAEAATVHEQELAQLREEHEHATAEIKRLQESFAEDGDGQPAAEIEHLRTRLAEIESAYTHATSELETLRTTMDAAADAVRDREQLRAELAELESAHAEAETIHEGELAVLREAHAHATAEIERLQTLLADAQIEEHERARVGDEHAEATAELERLQATLAELEASHARDLAEMREAHGHATAELERLQGALAEAETTASNHAEEKKELVAQRDRLQRDLAESLERLESLDAVVRNRDELRAELEQLRAGNSDAQEALLVADRVRESQIVLEAERDRALAELERVEVIANEAQSIAEEQTRLLAEERTRHESERESLLAQHTILEAKLHDALDRLGAAAALADERGKELQLAAERLHNALGEEPEAAPADEGKRSKSRRRQKTNIEPAREPNAREGAAAESEDTKSEAAADESAGVETDLKDGATGADNPTTYPNWRPEMDEYFDSETVFDDTFAESNGAGAAVLQSIEDEVGSPAWGKSLDRVLGLFDSETTRLHELRGKLTGLGREMATREARIKELEAEVQRFQIERLRDQEMVDRLKHELAERNNRLERALASTQELSTIIQGGQVR